MTAFPAGWPDSAKECARLLGDDLRGALSRERRYLVALDRAWERAAEEWFEADADSHEAGYFAGLAEARHLWDLYT